jgi:hypothetical protein
MTPMLVSLRQTCRDNPARLCTGLHQAEHVELAKIVDQIPGAAQQSIKSMPSSGWPRKYLPSWSRLATGSFTP